jgi:hypothetical protein
MKTKLIISLSFLTLLTLSLLASPFVSATDYDIYFGSEGTEWIVQTVADYNIDYGQGSGFKVQDITNNIIDVFTVTSGSLQGTGNLNATTSGGIFIFTPTTTGTLTVTSTSTAFYVTGNGAPLVAGNLNFVAGSTYTILWQYNVPPGPPIIIIGATNSILYFRSDTYTNNNATANGLDPANTNSPTNVNTTITTETVTYGFRVWTLHRFGTTTELTNGLPNAQVTRTTNGYGWQNGTWLCPQTTLAIGVDAIKVGIYLSTDSGATWTQKATYITHPLLSAALLEQTWTFNLYTTRTASSHTAFTFGSLTYHSSINGIGLQPPTDTQLQSWRFFNGDWIGFILGTYTSQIGVAAYLLILMIPATTLYLRHRNFGPVLVMFALFGGSGGIVWLFIPGWAAVAVNILLVLGFIFLIWKVLR